MESDLLEMLSYVSAAVYGGTAVAAWRLHRRLGTVRSRWLLATFATLAGVVWLSLVLPEPGAPESGLVEAARDLTLVILLLFPYCLYRFASGFGSVARAVHVIAHVWLGALIVATLVMAPLPSNDEPLDPSQQWYLIAILGYWTALSLWVAIRLWRGGQGQPGVAKRRMQFLSAGTIIMDVALLIAGTRSQQGSAVQIITTLLGWASAGLFLVGFAPPGILRHAWRQGDERRLRRAEATLMGATTPVEVATTIVPHAAELLGGHGAALMDRDGQILAMRGFTAHTLRAIKDTRTESIDRDRLVLPLQTGCLVVQASVYAPFFGQEELELLRSLGTFVDLALGRIDLFSRELETRKELEKTNEELVALVYGISHDLRSPIVTVIGYLELLSSDEHANLGDEAKHFLERIAVSARYMDALIRDLLELSRIGRTQTEAEPVEVSAVIKDVALELQRAHPTATVEVGDLPIIVMNPIRARQLFTNLMENAVRHGGRDDITVTVSAEAADDGRACIVVADDGVGIPEAYRERVFGIFERLEGGAESGHGGTGIGLAMCRKIVESAGGTIDIASADVGTTLRITLLAGSTMQSHTDVEVQRQ